ncbi:MAG: tol-pal system protein YbgF [Desulfurivibrionaceae bacterium]
MKFITRHRSLLFCLLLSPLLTQCIATQQDLKSLELRLRTVNNKMRSLDMNYEDLHEETTNRANKNTVEALQKNLAGTANSIDQLQIQLLQVKGQMEENSHHYGKLQEEAQDHRDNLSVRFHDLHDGIENLRITQDDLTARINQLEQRIENNGKLIRDVSEGLSKEKAARAAEAAELARREANAAARAAKAAEEAKAKARAAANARRAENEQSSSGNPRIIEPAASKKEIEPAATATTTTSGSATERDPAKELYDSGIAAYSADKFKEAYAAFTNYIEKYPTGNLKANARFWLGDSLYAQKEYELAILEYQKVIADYPKHEKAPAALLKQGLAFEKLNDNDTAKLVYYKLVDDYPDSKQAAMGQKRLDSF